MFLLVVSSIIPFAQLIIKSIPSSSTSRLFAATEKTYLDISNITYKLYIETENQFSICAVGASTSSQNKLVFYVFDCTVDIWFLKFKSNTFYLNKKMLPKLQVLLVIGLSSLACFGSGQSLHDFVLIQKILNDIGKFSFGGG